MNADGNGLGADQRVASLESNNYPEEVNNVPDYEVSN